MFTGFIHSRHSVKIVSGFLATRFSILNGEASGAVMRIRFYQLFSSFAVCLLINRLRGALGASGLAANCIGGDLLVKVNVSLYIVDERKNSDYIRRF